MCCQGNHLGLAFRELLKSIPFFGKNVSDYECKAYELDKPVNCRHNIVLPEEDLPHEVCELMCWHCGKRYIGAFPQQTLLKQLECPQCHRTGHMFKTGQTVITDED